MLFRSANYRENKVLARKVKKKFPEIILIFGGVHPTIMPEEVIAEDFIDGLHDLFEKSYVHVPEDRFDVIESLAEHVSTLEEKVEEINIEKSNLRETIIEMKKISAVIKITEGMVETEKEKLTTIIETVDYTDDEQFVSDVKKLKEAFISKADAHLDGNDDKNDKLEGIEADIAKALKL